MPTGSDDAPWAPPIQTATMSARRPRGYSNVDLAQRFADNYWTEFRYVKPWKRWIERDGEVWKVDTTLHAFDAARRICWKASLECGALPMVAYYLGSFRTVEAVFRLARRDPRIGVMPDQQNAKPPIGWTH